MAKQFDDEQFFKEIDKGKYGEYIKHPITADERAVLLGKNMKRLRERANLSQNALCKILECKKQTYSGYENGKHEPRLETIIRLASLYDVPVELLAGKKRSDEFDPSSIIEDGYLQHLEQQDDSFAFEDNKRLDALSQQVNWIQKEIAKLRKK